MKKMEVVRKLLTYIGKDAEEDKVIAEACLMLMPEEPKKEEPKKEEAKKGRKPFDMGKLKALIMQILRKFLCTKAMPNTIWTEV